MSSSCGRKTASGPIAVRVARRATRHRHDGYYPRAGRGRRTDRAFLFQSPRTGPTRRRIAAAVSRRLPRQAFRREPATSDVLAEAGGENHPDPGLGAGRPAAHSAMDYAFLARRSRMSARSCSCVGPAGSSTAGFSSAIAAALMRFTILTRRNTTQAMIRKLMTAMMKLP